METVNCKHVLLMEFLNNYSNLSFAVYKAVTYNKYRVMIRNGILYWPSIRSKAK